MGITRRHNAKTPPGPPPKKTVVETEKEAEPVENGKMYLLNAETDNDWQPSFGAVVKMLLSIRIASALWGIIHDCDEVYNYWEALHLFLYGNGFQTWEYSPDYAIRSYFYIYLHYIPGSLFVDLFGMAKVAVFTLVRLTLGVFCLFGEYYAYTAICKKINVSTGRFFIAFSMFSSGVFMASTAFVPSSFCMAMTYYMIGLYLNECWTLGILCVGFTTLVGWPFFAVLGLPIFMEMNFLRSNLRDSFIVTTLLSGLVITFAQVQTDGYYYGKRTSAPLNIFLYNVLKGPGPELYGREPFSYYVKNLFVNWNIAVFLAPLGLPLSFLYFKKVWVTDDIPVKWGFPNCPKLMKKFVPIILLAISSLAWMAIFGTQPHKEERFLFPVYPLIALFAALACDAIDRLWIKNTSRDKLGGIYTVLALFALLSFSRTFSVYNNYGSHIDIYKALHEELAAHEDFARFHDPIRVCVGKEWHRFPSSFFLPQSVLDGNHIPRKVEMSFLQSEFRGILPKPFEYNVLFVNITRHTPIHMNDKNQEEVTRYVPLNSCDYVIDVDKPASEREPDYRTMPDQLKPIVSMPFIDAANSPTLYRSFYWPVFSARHNVMTNYTLYRRVVR